MYEYVTRLTLLPTQKKLKVTILGNSQERRGENVRSVMYEFVHKRRQC